MSLSLGGARQESLVRAGAAWDALLRVFTRSRGARRVVLDRRGHRAHLWPLTQVLHAAALLEPLRVGPAVRPALVDGLRRFATDRGWTAGPWPGWGRRVYYDDNAWLGLAAAQAWLLSGDEAARGLAGRALAVALAGEDPAGGVRWNEETGARHACSTGPAVMLALRLRGEGGLDVARRGLAFLDGTLARPDGLVADHVTETGRIEEHVWSYNQGTTVGAHLLAWHVTGREAHLGRAQWLAAAAAEYLGVGERLWREPPAFVAVFLRQLMALDAHTDGRRWQGLVDRYLERVWLEGRDRANGLVTAGGIGSYDEGVVIDQAAVVQLWALQAMPAEWRRLAC